MIVNAPTWGGAQAGTNLLFSSANRDANMGWAAKLAALNHEMKQRAAINAALRDMAQRREQKKAAAKASTGSWGGLIGAGAGGIAGLALAPATGGASLLASAAMGAGLGGTIGSGVDQAMGGQGSNLGSNLLDFSTGLEDRVDDIPNVDYFDPSDIKDPNGPWKQGASGGKDYKDQGY